LLGLERAGNGFTETEKMELEGLIKTGYSSGYNNADGDRKPVSKKDGKNGKRKSKKSADSN
jgi:hypothetical protein